MKMRGTILAALVGFGLVACDDATGPTGPQGEVEFAAIGDGDAGSSASESPTPSYSTSGAQGNVTFRARVYVRTDAGKWVEVTSRGAQTATVEASSSGSGTLFADARVNAGSYDRVRVVFESVEAEVTGGVQLVVGGVLQGEVRVDMGTSGQAAVEREIHLQVSAGASSRVVVDLNSDAWLSRADAQTRAVSRAEFESAVRVFAAS